MKVYIAGKIRGDKNYRAKFEEAERHLKTLGHSVMNPAVLPPSGFRHEEYMKVCLAMLDICDAVYMLPDWKKSEGARTEYNVATKKGKVIMFSDITEGKEIEIIGLRSMQTSGNVPPEARFKVVFKYREKDPDEGEGQLKK